MQYSQAAPFISNYSLWTSIEKDYAEKMTKTIKSNQSNFIMKCDKRTQNIESSVRMTVQKNIKKTRKHVNTNILAN